MKLMKCLPVFLAASLMGMTTYADDLIVTGFTGVSGTIDGNLIVEDGSFAALDNALVKENVEVEPGGRLSSSLSTSTIEGNVEAEEARGVTLNRDVVFGDVQVKKSGGGGFVVVFNSLVGGNVQLEENDASIVFCSGKTVLGDVQVSKNVATLVFILNSDVGGNLECGENVVFGRIIIRSNDIGENLECGENVSHVDIRIGNNGISGNLECRENDPNPIVSGNVVAGDIECDD